MDYPGLNHLAALLEDYCRMVDNSEDQTLGMYISMSEFCLFRLGEDLVRVGFPFEKTIPYKGVHHGVQKNPVFWISKKRGAGGKELPLLRSNLRKHTESWKQDMLDPNFIEMVRKTIVCAIGEFKIQQQLDIWERDGKITKSSDGKYSLIQ